MELPFPTSEVVLFLTMQVRPRWRVVSALLEFLTKKVSSSAELQRFSEDLFVHQVTEQITDWSSLVDQTQSSCIQQSRALLPMVRRVIFSTSEVRQELSSWQKVWEKKGWYWTTPYDVVYPYRLRVLDEPPVVVWSSRPWVEFELERSVAVVGSRKMSSYGERAARALVAELAESGCDVVSGCALGVDTVAHQMALRAGRKTVGWLGYGLQHVSERVHRQFSSARACVATEFLPQENVQKWSFPQRNRLIAGLSDAVVVIEAKEKSGTLHTVRAAHDQGREVFVVSPAFDSPNRQGILELIEKTEAHVIANADDVWRFMEKEPGWGRGSQISSPVAQAQPTTPIERVVRFLENHQGKALRQELQTCLYPEGERVLEELQLAGVITQHAGVVLLSCMIQS